VPSERFYSRAFALRGSEQSTWVHPIIWIICFDFLLRWSLAKQGMSP
jgi:hypothetical protein